MTQTPAALFALVLLAWAAAAQGAAPLQFASAPQLAELTLEQLSRIDVTSVSGRPQGLMQAAASVYVITAQDIRRSAATSLTEALRLAPNLQRPMGDQRARLPGLDRQQAAGAGGRPHPLLAPVRRGILGCQ